MWASAWASAMVAVLHAVFVAFMVAAPWSSNRVVLVTHFLLTPFLWLHWALHDDTCALTQLERYLRGGVAAERTFMHAVVSPVYKIPDEAVAVASWYASVGLWLVTASKLTPGDVREVLLGTVTR